MDDTRFITRPLSIVLDAVRGAAALLVLIQHAYDIGVYTGPYPFTPRLSHNCVIVFFVLSGLVIGSSVAGGRTSLARYAIARFARIWPTAAAAVGFSCLV